MFINHIFLLLDLDLLDLLNFDLFDLLIFDLPPDLFDLTTLGLTRADLGVIL